MGKRDRERIARIKAGKEKPISEKQRSRIQKVGLSVLQRSSTSNQIEFLAESLHSGRLSPSKLKRTLAENARKEMRKGAEKLVKRGKDPTVDLLLAEYRKDAEFQELASEVGLDSKWFTDLAEKYTGNGG